MSKDHLRNLASGGKPETQIPERQLPGRVNVEFAAKLLGFQPGDMAILIRHKMLLPLGKPKPNAPKYFATIYVLALANDPEWLDEATQIIYDYWKEKNSRKGIPESESVVESQTAFAA